ncbi:MAG: glycerate kinase [Opitutae bacterium]|nr:glycerate kinase [Opitutae bacterium]
MRVLIAFDKFKDSLTATTACTVVAQVLSERQRDWQLDLCPLADGGEGFAEILTRAAGGELHRFSVMGPRGAQVVATLGLVSAENIPAAARRALALPALAAEPATRIAVIEMAAASGLALLSSVERDPWQTTTLGTGQLLLAARDLGAKAILLGVGGSATNELGLGALSALGLNFKRADGVRVAVPTPQTWAQIAAVTGSVPADFPALCIACDVTNPLLGSNGCSAVYGPQKGLRAADLPAMERALATQAERLRIHCGQPESLLSEPGVGAAGGIAFGLLCAARARLIPGATLVADWLDLDARLAAADLVITGEGRFDASSLQGKGPGAVAARALALGKQVHVFAGQVAVAESSGLRLHAITPATLPLTEALRAGSDLLAAAVRQTW